MGSGRYVCRGRYVGSGGWRNGLNMLIHPIKVSFPAGEVPRPTVGGQWAREYTVHRHKLQATEDEMPRM
jgi:hypothetical protein